MAPSCATFNNKFALPSIILEEPFLSSNASSWIFTAAFIGLVLVAAGLRDSAVIINEQAGDYNLDLLPVYESSGKFPNAPCDEIYVVREGETLNTISDKCRDPFIVERNPHIHDPDDVFPGLVIRIVPYSEVNNN